MSSLTRIFPHKNWTLPYRRFCPHTGKKGQENPYSGMFYAVLQREKCPYPEFFWSVFSRIWTEYGKILTLFTHFSLFHYGTNLNQLRNGIGNYSEFSKISNSNLIYFDNGIVRIMSEIYGVRIDSSLKSSTVFTQSFDMVLNTSCLNYLGNFSRLAFPLVKDF